VGRKYTRNRRKVSGLYTKSELNSQIGEPPKINLYPSELMKAASLTCLARVESRVLRGPRDDCSSLLAGFFKQPSWIVVLPVYRFTTFESFCDIFCDSFECSPLRESNWLLPQKPEESGKMRGASRVAIKYLYTEL